MNIWEIAIENPTPTEEDPPVTWVKAETAAEAIDKFVKSRQDSAVATPFILSVTFVGDLDIE